MVKPSPETIRLANKYCDENGGPPKPAPPPKAKLAENPTSLWYVEWLEPMPTGEFFMPPIRTIDYIPSPPTPLTLPATALESILNALSSPTPKQLLHQTPPHGRRKDR